MKINRPLCALMAALGVSYAALGHAKVPEIKIQNPLQIQVESSLLVNALFMTTSMFGQKVALIPEENDLVYQFEYSDEYGLPKESISRICRGEPRTHLKYDPSRKILSVERINGEDLYSIQNPNLAAIIKEIGKIPDC